MTRSSINQLLKINNENDARQFAEKCMRGYRRDPEMKQYPAKEIFESDLRWCFGEDNLPGKENMPFDRIAMWAKIAAETQA